MSGKSRAINSKISNPEYFRLDTKKPFRTSCREKISTHVIVLISVQSVFIGIFALVLALMVAYSSWDILSILFLSLIGATVIILFIFFLRGIFGWQKLNKKALATALNPNTILTYGEVASVVERTFRGSSLTHAGMSGRREGLDVVSATGYTLGIVFTDDAGKVRTDFISFNITSNKNPPPEVGDIVMVAFNSIRNPDKSDKPLLPVILTKYSIL